MDERLRKLLAGLLSEIGENVDALTTSGDVGQFTSDMAHSLGDYHLAAYMTATGKRVLTVDGRNTVLRALDTQLDYLDGFTATIDPAAVTDATRARALLYANSIRDVWERGTTGGLDLPAYAPIHVGCSCGWAIEEQDDGTVYAYWRLGATEHHCPECLALADEYSPYVVTSRDIAGDLE